MRDAKLTSFDDYECPFNLEYTIDDQVFTNQEQQLSDEVHRFMRGLSNRQREIIYLRFVHEMSFEEISVIMNIHVQSARNLLARSMDKIRKEASMVSLLCFLQHFSV